MKQINQRLDKHLKRVRHHSNQYLHKRPYVLPLLGAVLGIFIVIGIVLTHRGDALKPSGSHVVYLFDKGKKETLDTKAQTVGQLLKNLPLHLIAEDVVEPSRDTTIVEDNFRVNVYRARPVIVVDKGSRTVTLTAQKSARVVAENAGVQVYPEDKATFLAGDIRQNIVGEQVVINRATPVFLNLYGTALNVRTRAKTVGDLVKEKQIKLQGGDTLQPDANTPISANLQVFVVRSGTKIMTVEEDIPPPVQVVNDASLSFGTQVVRQPGVPGKKAVTYQVQMQNGKEAGRTIIQQAIIQEPVTQIVARGSTVSVTGSHESWMAAAGIASGQYGYVNFIVSRESGWRPGALNGSGCAGLGQACPGSKLAAVCPAWQNDPVCQLRFFSGYASRYGGWGGAYNYWLGHGYW
jgi:resuscitation-promoting factor RpfB